METSMENTHRKKHTACTPLCTCIFLSELSPAPKPTYRLSAHSTMLFAYVPILLPFNLSLSILTCGFYVYSWTHT